MLLSESAQAREPNGKGRPFPHPMVFIIALGFFVRLFAFFYTPVVSPDGTLYIHQARALFYAQWDQLTSCALSYISLYPFLIAGVYGIFHDWVAAAKSVSLFFGTLTLLPSYLLLRRFFDQRISAASTLVVSLIPVLVARSGDVVRGPTAWFFAALGLYLFVLHVHRSKPAFLFLSSLSYLLAASNRIEFLLFPIVSFLYILCLQQTQRLRTALYFAAPAVFIVLLALSIANLLDLSTGSPFRLHEMLGKFTEPIVGYKALRANLADLIDQPVKGALELFLEKARHLVWLIALETLLVFIIRAFFYPFFFIFLIGLPWLKKEIKGNKPLQFVLILSASALALLYLHILQTWVIGNRFMVLFMIPAFVFLGFGVKRTLGLLKTRLRLNPRVALVIFCLFVLGTGLPKNLKPKEMDKGVFKNIGEFIARQEGNTQVIHVASSLNILRWVSFYANINYRGAPCPQPYQDFDTLVGRDYDTFLRNLKNSDIQYFVWEENHWPSGTFDFRREMRLEDFKALGTWSHPDTGRMVLYRVY